MITYCTWAPCEPTWFKMYKVIKEAGMEPAQRRATTGQGMSRWRQRPTVPPHLVMEANSKSVPTAMCGLMPMKKIKRGVINEPPPTPVRPMMVPTTKPANTK